MPSLNIDLDFFDHPKVVNLEALLGDDAAVIPIRLWAYSGKFHPESGKLAGYTADRVEKVVKWRGRRGAAIAALIKSGFLEEIPGGYQCHDWIEWQGHIHAFRQKAKTMAKTRWDKAKGGQADASHAARNAASISSSNASAVHGNAQPPLIPQKGEGDFADLPEKMQEILQTWSAYIGYGKSKKLASDLAKLKEWGAEKASWSIAETMAKGHLTLHVPPEKGPTMHPKESQEDRYIRQKQEAAKRDGEIWTQECEQAARAAFRQAAENLKNSKK